MNRYVVKKFIPHCGPHIDEVGAAVLVRRYPNEALIIEPGCVVEPRKVDYDEATALMKGELLLGQGGGMFDDKEPVTGERIEGTCCTLKMADFLGIRDNPELDKILRAINRVDGHASASSSDLSSLMKNAINCFPVEQHATIFRWAERAIDAIIDYCIMEENAKRNGAHIVCTDYFQPISICNRMIENGEVDNPEIAERMVRVFSASEKQVENCIEASFIARAMKVTGVPDEETEEWLCTAIQKFYEQQVLYHQAIGEIRTAGRHYPIRPRYEGNKIDCLIIKSDNPQVANASRNSRFRYAVTIIRRSSGNVAIIPNRHYDLDMSLVWALIRMEETPFEQRRFAELDDYTRPGNHPCAPNWHMMNGGVTLNGSHFITAEPTKIPDSTLVEMVQIGFGDEGLELFNKMRRQSERHYISQNGYAAPIEYSLGNLSEEVRQDLEKAFDSAN